MIRMLKTCAGAVALVATLSATSAMASELVVVQARGASFTPGQVIGDGQSVEVPAGGSVMLMSADGSSVTLSGPYSGVPSVGGDGDRDRGVVDALSQMFKKRQASIESLGAVRATGVDTEDDSLPQPWVVSVHATGPVCVRPDQAAVLWRRDGSTQANVELRELGGAFRGTAPWPAGHQTLRLPASFQFKDGRQYRTKLDGQEATFTILEIPATIDNDGVRAAWMASKGCEPQALALIDSLN